MLLEVLAGRNYTVKDSFALLDTNILVYATDAESPFHRRAKEIRDCAERGEMKVCLALQVLTEFYSTVTNLKNRAPLSPKEAKEEVERYLESRNFLKICIRTTTIEKMVELAENHKIKGQNIYDVQLVATMLDNGVKEIYTANDKDFKEFEEIEVVNPFK